MSKVEIQTIQYVQQQGLSSYSKMILSVGLGAI